MKTTINIQNKAGKTFKISNVDIFENCDTIEFQFNGNNVGAKLSPETYVAAQTKSEITVKISNYQVNGRLVCTRFNNTMLYMELI